MAPSASIAPGTGVGAVHLGVTDGAQALAFYRDVVGLGLLSQDPEGPQGPQGIRMGSGGRELVVLHPGASRPVQVRNTGLYHLALVVPSRRELARAIARLARLRYPQSPTDHVMTKSDYLWDPDGNGIEIYAETPEDGTFGVAAGMFVAHDSSGAPRSGRDPIDLEALFAELQPGDRIGDGLPAETHIGHVHLHVRDLAEAVSFYHDILGFDIMGVADRWGAAFVSAGGYHHHVGLNTWAGEGAPPAPPEAAGLRRFSIELPDEVSLEEVMARIRGADVVVEQVAEEADPAPPGPSFEVADPSNNRFRLLIRN